MSRLARRSIRRRRSDPIRILIPLLCFSVALQAGFFYWHSVRRWFARWGTTPDEITHVLAGDSIISQPTDVATMAITIDAPPAAVWPWLVQIGNQRGGLYSYDWLDELFGFLDGPSADRILPEFQQLAVGDTIRFGSEELAVAVIDPERSLALSYRARGMEWVWEWELCPLPGSRTRLLARSTERVPRSPLFWVFMRVTEPASFVMGRRMMFGLKERAEGARR